MLIWMRYDSLHLETDKDMISLSQWLKVGMDLFKWCVDVVTDMIWILVNNSVTLLRNLLFSLTLSKFLINLYKFNILAKCLQIEGNILARQVSLCTKQF